jgi:hypothetical protein
MKTKCFVIAVGLLLAASLSLPAHAAQVVGSVSLMRVYAYGTPPDGKKGPIWPRSDVQFGELLETVTDGALHVRFIDESMLRLGSKSTLRIEEYVFDPNAGKQSQIINMAKGVMRFISGKLAREAIKIKTPTALIGIRGTDVEVAVADDGSTDVHVNAGEVDVSPADGGDTVTVGPGQGASVGAGGGGATTTASSTPSSDAGVSDSGGGDGDGAGSGDADAGGGGGGGNSCFTAGTKVRMADGTEKNIEDVVIGDRVVGEYGIVNQVTGLKRPTLQGRKLYALNGGPPFVTSEHPFLTAEGWKSISPSATHAETDSIVAARLLPGDEVVFEGAISSPIPEGGMSRAVNLLPGQGFTPLQSITAHAADPDTVVYNLTLDGNHTYYAGGYLVHNCAQ